MNNVAKKSNGAEQMHSSKALSFLSVVFVLLIPKIACAQAPAGHTPAGPTVSPGTSAGAVHQTPAHAKPTAPVLPTDATRPTPVGTEPEATTATYGDWLLRCQRIATVGAPQQVCDVTQTVQAQGQQNPLLQLSFGHPIPKEPMKLTIYAPVNVSFPSVARLAIDEKDVQPAELTWRRCQPGGCVADLEIKDELLKHWRAQVGGGVIKIMDATGREIAIPFSFRGLAQALDALLKN
jgi:invasion protein IalB